MDATIMTIIVLGNIAFRPNGPLEKGRVIDSHAHNFDHVTMISHGSMLIEVLEPPIITKHDGSDGIVGTTIEWQEPKMVRSSTVKSAKQARNFVLILKDTWHRLTALEDGTVYQCIYAHRDEEGNVVEDYTGWEEAYS